MFIHVHEINMFMLVIIVLSLGLNMKYHSKRCLYNWLNWFPRLTPDNTASCIFYPNKQQTNRNYFETAAPL